MEVSTESFKFKIPVVPPPPPYMVDDHGKRFKAPMPMEGQIYRMFKFFGIDPEQIVKCPVCEAESSIRGMLPHLNNIGGVDFFDLKSPKSYPNHGWTFKQIGKWLESLGY